MSEYPVNPRRRRRRRRRLNPRFLILVAALALLVLGLIFGIASCAGGEDTPPETTGSTEPPVPSTEATTVPTTEPGYYPDSRASVLVAGDMLMHLPVIDANKTGSGYDFSGVLAELRDDASRADLAIANLETTLAGADNGYPYHGWPNFNCPDAIVDDLKAAGFDLLLTSNNHSYDTKSVGLRRTLQVIRDRGLTALGTRDSESEPEYVVTELNGIRIGMACYTYETDGQADAKSLNSLPVAGADAPLISSFDPSYLSLFYGQVATTLENMKNAGAEITMVFLHWGEEYKTEPNATQRQMAQKLCDMGVDVIIGGHPHVVQPMEMLTSTLNPDHETLCVYSLGNFISNQRRELMDLDTGHTEDGLVVTLHFAKYADGTVLVEAVEGMPVWVYLNGEPGVGEYRVLNLDGDSGDWQSRYGITAETLTLCRESQARILAIVGDGLTAINAHLTTQQEAFEDAHLNE